MLAQETKIFRDSVHGYISVPVDYVINFIDTEIFQRLRYIEQTGMRTLYPSARHDRFIHSLGTYFLGHKAFESFKRNIRRSYHGVAGKKDHYQIFNNETENEVFWDKCQFLFEIACLLHDCGHAPFSHTLEFHYDTQLEERLTLKEKLKEYIGSTEFQKDFSGQGSPHERMSALLVCSDFATAIESLCKKYKFDTVDMGDPIEFVVRMIIGCGYSQQNDVNQIKNCLISLLNSKSIDVDSLDYIIRDARLSGVDNMNIDVERLLGSLTLIETTEFNDCSFKRREISANIIEGVLKGSGATLSGKCRGKMYISRNISGRLKGSLDVTGNFKTKNPISIESDSKELMISINGASYTNNVPRLPNISTVRIKGVLDKYLEIEGPEINFEVENNSQVELSADKFGLNATYVDAKLNGTFTGRILGDFTYINGGKLRCTLGYHKSSLSVIQNVVLARNYEYQWIYTHHKVVYYSNFLLIDLFRNCVDYILANHVTSGGKRISNDEADEAIAKALSWYTMINHSDTQEEYCSYSIGDYKFFRPTDADIVALFKMCQLSCDSDCLLHRQLKEYYTRKYKKSLWKSYAEFNIFFSDFTDSEKKNVFNQLMQNSSYCLPKQYGYLSDDWEHEFNTYGLKNVVWVNGDSKLKFLNPDDTYILFKDCALTYRTVDFDNNTQVLEKLNLFYIYFDYVDENKTIDKKGLKSFLSSKIK